MSEDPTPPEPSSPARRRLNLRLGSVSLVSWRDALLTLLPITLAAGAVIFATLHFIRPAPPDALTIAAGPVGSNFYSVAERYRVLLARDGVDLKLVTSLGSADNLGRIVRNEVDLALVQSGVTRDEGTDDLMSLGTMFRQPVFVFYRAEAPITRLAELAGKRIAVGREGSGTHFLTLALLEGNGIKPGGESALVNLEGENARQALLAGEVDAIFLSGDSAGIGTTRDLLHAENVRLFDFFPQAEAYERRYRYLNRLDLPAGAFDLGNNLPADRITLMAPTVELLAHSDLHPALSDLLVGAAVETHNRGTLLQNPGEFPHPIEHDYPMSPDATRYFKSGKSFAYRYLPFWLASLVSRALVVIVPLLVILIPSLRLAPALYGWRVKRRIYKRYGDLMELERATLEQMTPDQRSAVLARLDEMEKAVINVKIPGAFADRIYILRRHIRFVRETLSPGTPKQSPDDVLLS